MVFKFVILFLLLNIFVEAKYRSLYDKWINQYNKHYSSKNEYELRYQIFSVNYEKIQKRNLDTLNRGFGATYGLNRFSDLSSEEFLLLYSGIQSRRDSFGLDNQDGKEFKKVIPNSFDWRSLNKVTKVKNQGPCGSCWAHAVTENVESVWMIARNIQSSQMPPMSPQQLVDCDSTAAGCSGASQSFENGTYGYIINAGGLDSEKSYPYTHENGPCRFNKQNVVGSINNWTMVENSGNESNIKLGVVTFAPLVIEVAADGWQSYKSGIMSPNECGVWVDHVVQVVGYNVESNPPFWIIRNSWGDTWGEEGYIRLEYGQNTCSLGWHVSTSIV